MKLTKENIEQIESFGIFNDDVFNFECRADHIYTFTCKSLNGSIEINFIPIDDCEMIFKDMSFEEVKQMDYDYFSFCTGDMLTNEINIYALIVPNDDKLILN